MSRHSASFGEITNEIFMYHPETGSFSPVLTPNWIPEEALQEREDAPKGVGMSVSAAFQCGVPSINFDDVLSVSTKDILAYQKKHKIKSLLATNAKT